MKKVPIKSVFVNKIDCCGCSACASICPVSAISMKEDDEGFLYPLINHGACIGCEQCKNVCPIILADKKRKQY